jgi:chromosome segregation ATPase
MDVTMEQQRQFERDLDNLTTNIGHMNTMLERMGEQVGRLDSRIGILEALDERHSLLCPYREDIRSARNNKEIIDQHSEAIETIQSALGDQKGVNAKTAAALASLSGIIGSALTTLVSRFLGG